MIDWDLFGNDKPLHFILGPCQIESEKHARLMAEGIVQEVGDLIEGRIIFKASYDKANRTSYQSPRGVGLKEGLSVLKGIRDDFCLPVTTDVHSAYDAAVAGAVVDLVQIPALLSRQTDIIKKAGDATRLAASPLPRGVSIKKGQFTSPANMRYAEAKVGHNRTVIIERGTTFGYDGLVVDMAGLRELKHIGRVVIDASHACQRQNYSGSTGGCVDDIPYIARAAVANRIAGVFLEVHDNPSRALSDGKTSIPLVSLRRIIRELVEIDQVVKQFR